MTPERDFAGAAGVPFRFTFNPRTKHEDDLQTTYLFRAVLKSLLTFVKIAYVNEWKDGARVLGALQKYELMAALLDGLG